MRSVIISSLVSFHLNSSVTTMIAALISVVATSASKSLENTAFGAPTTITSLEPLEATATDVPSSRPSCPTFQLRVGIGSNPGNKDRPSTSV